MRATPAYVPYMTPWGERIEFDEVTASLRYTQLRLEEVVRKHKHTERCDGWFDYQFCPLFTTTLPALTYVNQQIAECAKLFERSKSVKRSSSK